jgi:hypothetical protein
MTAEGTVGALTCVVFILAYYFSLSLHPKCRNWSPNYSVFVFIEITIALVQPF